LDGLGNEWGWENEECGLRRGRRPGLVEGNRPRGGEGQPRERRQKSEKSLSIRRSKRSREVTKS